MGRERITKGRAKIRFANGRATISKGRAKILFAPGGSRPRGNAHRDRLLEPVPVGRTFSLPPACRPVPMAYGERLLLLKQPGHYLRDHGLCHGAGEVPRRVLQGSGQAGPINQVHLPRYPIGNHDDSLGEAVRVRAVDRTTRGYEGQQHRTSLSGAMPFTVPTATPTTRP